MEETHPRQNKQIPIIWGVIRAMVKILQGKGMREASLRAQIDVGSNSS